MDEKNTDDRKDDRRVENGVIKNKKHNFQSGKPNGKEKEREDCLPHGTIRQECFFKKTVFETFFNHCGKKQKSDSAGCKDEVIVCGERHLCDTILNEKRKHKQLGYHCAGSCEKSKEERRDE
jgi:hypothetical protein